MINYIQTWCIVLPTLQLYILAKTKNYIIAYETTCLYAVTYLASAGIIGWFELFDIDIESAKNDPFYGYSPYVANHIITPMLIYQGWNTIACLLHKDLRTPESMIHHILAFTLALCGMDSLLHYWAIYFFGITEVSTVPLQIMILQKKLGYNNTYASYAFAGLFTVVRLIYWPIYYWHCINQAFIVDMRPVHFYVFTSISTLLTVMQFYWGYKIISKKFTNK